MPTHHPFEQRGRRGGGGGASPRNAEEDGGKKMGENLEKSKRMEVVRLNFCAENVDCD